MRPEIRARKGHAARTRFKAWAKAPTALLLFAFMMGYSATLAEPALNALGTTVEQITIPVFHKFGHLQDVASIESALPNVLDEVSLMVNEHINGSKK